MSVSAITIGSVIKAYFIFLGLPKYLGEGPFEEWLAKDGFPKSVLSDPAKKELLRELEQLKEKFRSDLVDSGKMVDDAGVPITPLRTTELISAAMIQIDKLRLLIFHELSIVKNYHKPSGVNYIVARAYWVDGRGKKFRKFAKNIGSEEKVLERGKITTSKLKEVEEEIDRMMINQYRMEYG